MRRAVEKYLEDPLAEGFLRANIKQGDTLEVHAASEQLAFKVIQPEQSEPANGSSLVSRGDAAARRNEGCHCRNVDSYCRLAFSCGSAAVSRHHAASTAFVAS